MHGREVLKRALKICGRGQTQSVLWSLGNDDHQPMDHHAGEGGEMQPGERPGKRSSSHARRWKRLAQARERCSNEQV